MAHQKLSTKFVQLSATTAGVKDVKEIVQVARNDKIIFKRNTILFIDEIHRFNKLQQVTSIPWCIACIAGMDKGQLFQTMI